MYTNIKAALMLRRIRQFQLAHALGISEPILSRVISGRQAASPELRKRMAKALRVDEKWLFASIEIAPAPRAPLGITANATA